MSITALRSSFLRSALRLLSFLAFALFLNIPLLADSHARIVRLSYLDGNVELDKGDGRGFSAAYLNMPVIHGSKVWARDGQAEVELEDGSSIRLTPNTIVAFSDLSLTNNGERNTSVELEQGTAYFDIRHRDSNSLQLQFGRSRITLEKSARFRVDSDKHNFEVAVLSGEIDVANPSGTEVAVKKGETIRLDSDDPDRYYLAKGVDAENYDSWDNDRVKWHDQAVSTASTLNGNSGIAYGLSDLSMYGSYFYVPGYGYMWRPSSVGLGWDPFADGYWVSYPGFGYTFVSGYPWGWAPYRYGSWQFVNSYGWCWAPGSNWNQWQAVPPIRNVPPNYRPPRFPPRHGPPVIAVSNGVATPMPRRPMIVDNDAIEHQRPHATKVTTASGDVIRQGPNGTAPAQGFAATTPAVAPTAPASMPGVSIAPIPQRVGPRFGGDRHGEDGRNFAGAAGVTQTAPATSARVPIQASSPTTAAAPPARMTAPVRSEPRIPTASPRMESHAPAMQASHPMMSPSAGMSRSMPAMSSGGGGHMSSPSMGGGGGMHGGGGGGGGPSHGGHR